MNENGGRSQYWVLALLGAIALVSSACISTGSDEADEAQPTTTVRQAQDPPAVTETDTQPELYARLDRLKVLTGDDRLVIQRTDAIVLVTDNEETKVAQAEQAVLTQPVFSPDGSALVWTELGSGFASNLVIHDVASGEQRAVPTPFASFYSSWDPASETVAFLGNAPRGGVGLATVEVKDAAGLIPQPQPMPVGVAVPFFFQWSQDSSELLAHAGSGLSLVELNGQDNSVLADVSSAFQTPAWVPDGSVAFAVMDSPPDATGASQLVRFNLTDTSSEALFSFDGRMMMDLSPDGSTLGIGIIGPGGVGPAPIALRQTTALRQDSDTVETPGVLTLDVGSSEISRLTATAPLALEWSPDSNRLLILEQSEDQNGATQDSPVFQWLVIDNDGAAHISERVTLSAAFTINYLPFYDQYTKSSTLWSPDSSRFVFPGAALSGETGIWIHAPGQDQTSVRLTDGEIAFWSP